LNTLRTGHGGLVDGDGGGSAISDGEVNTNGGIGDEERTLIK